MILGLGSDLVDIRRIERTLSRFGERFTHRLFTEAERRKAARRPLGKAATYAKRFAAKEACAKALGSGFRNGVFWRDMGVVNDSSGRPTLQLTGGAARRMVAITPPGMAAKVELSLSDEYPYAQASVIIYAAPSEDK
ncbi:MAG: holo-ACP synthase [Rhodospirillaceae bacterium]|nr:MAG: holo-ACP synthase [Rhodospirillaceae bacterium]